MELVELPKGKFNSCSCVIYARWKSGIDFPPIGLAKNLKTNSDWPSVGAIVKTTDNPYTGHLAVVIAIEGNTLTVAESNYIPCREGTRKLNIDDASIIGYLNPR